jgi:hypothetical protein
MYYAYDNIRLPSQLKQITRNAVAEASATASPSPQLYSERLGTDSHGDLYIRSFLINSRPNSRGWAVSPDTLRQNVLSIVGKPLVLNDDLQHPQWRSEYPAEANYLAQQRKAIGVVEKVFYNAENDSYYADSKVTDPKAKEYINSFNVGRNGKNAKIPIPVSPQLIYNSKTEAPNYYKNWFFSHLAIVDKGAYGPDARIINSCSGDKQTCSQVLAQSVASASGVSIPEAASIPAAAAVSAITSAAQSAYATPQPATSVVANASAEFKLRTKMPSYGYNGPFAIRAPANGKKPGRIA